MKKVQLSIGIALLSILLLFACNSNQGTSTGGDGGNSVEEGGGTIEEGGGPDEQEPDIALIVRKNASSAAAVDDIAALANAMEQMRNLPCTDARSWYYQGAMHWVPGSFPNNENPLCPQYTGSDNGSPLMPAWDNCTHHGVSQFHFLVWHRLYIYYLENIVRELSGKADFALPYWDYATVAPTPPNRIMPEEFRTETSSLFENARLPSLNEGDPIQAFMDNSLDLTNLFENDTYQSFNSAIDAAPHGAMHNYIGGGYAGLQVYNQIFRETTSGLMAIVASAAFDPIFWTHHAEIDFIWAQWMRTANGALPSLADMEANSNINYSFFDKNGNPVNLTIAEARELAFSLPVTYEPFVDGETVEARTTREDPLSETTTVARQPLSQRVRGAQTQFSSSLSIPRNKIEDLRSLATEPEKSRGILELTVSFTGNRDPRGIYEVYLQHDHLEGDVESPENLVGQMTFFGATFHATRQGEGNAEKITKTFNFDIADEIDFSDFQGNFKVSIKNLIPDGDEITVESFHLKKRTIVE